MLPVVLEDDPLLSRSDEASNDTSNRICFRAALSKYALNSLIDITANRQVPKDYQAVFFPAFIFAHLARCAAAILLRAAGESVGLPSKGTTFAASRTFAQRALWAAAILARADADSFRVLVPFLYVLPNAASAAPIPRSSLVNRSCSFFNNRTTPDKLDIEFPPREGL